MKEFHTNGWMDGLTKKGPLSALYCGPQNLISSFGIAQWVGLTSCYWRFAWRLSLLRFKYNFFLNWRVIWAHNMNPAINLIFFPCKNFSTGLKFCSTTRKYNSFTQKIKKKCEYNFDWTEILYMHERKLHKYSRFWITKIVPNV